MIEVTAAIADDGPNLRSQIRAARSMGSKGKSSALRTPDTLRTSSTRREQGAARAGILPGRRGCARHYAAKMGGHIVY